MTWSIRTIGTMIHFMKQNQIFSVSGTGTVTSGGGKLIMVGRGSNSIASYDIATNTWSATSNVFSTTGRSVSYGNQKYIAVGEGTNTIAVSNDGQTWGSILAVPFSTAGYDIVYTGTNWVAAGQGGNAVSFHNGTSWVSINNGIGQLYTSTNYSLRYTFNSDTVSGTRLLNVVTGLYDSSLVNTATISSSVKRFGDRALYLNNTSGWNASTSQYVRTPTFDVSSSGFTLAMWLYPIGSLDVFIFDFPSAPAQNNNNMALHTTSTGTYVFYANQPQGSGFMQTGTGRIALNQWNHFCLTISPGATVTLYGNGTQMLSAGTISQVFGTKNGTLLGATYFPNNGFRGYIDEFMIFPRALSATEVANLYNTSSQLTGYGLTYDSATPRLWSVGAGLNTIAYASAANGTWTGTTIPNMTLVNAVGVSSTPLYVAGGTGTSNLQKSSDGTTWTVVTSPFSVATNDVKYNGTVWVAVGEGASHTIATSSDGTNWTGQGNTIFTLRGNKVRWNSTQSKWFAVGEGSNTLASSSDGITWTAISTTGYVDVSGIGLTFNL